MLFHIAVHSSTSEQAFNVVSQFDLMIMMVALRSSGWEHNYMVALCQCSCNVLCMLLAFYIILEYP